MPHHRFHPKPNRDEDEDLQPIGAVPDDLPKPKGIENRMSPPFEYLAKLFEKFEAATRSTSKKPNFKQDCLKEFFKKWREQAGPDLYPLVRLMLPERDSRRRTYNLKESKLGKAYREALGLDAKSDAAIKLEKWKTPTAKDPGAGEFSTVAYEVIRSRSSVMSATRTIDDVNRILDQLFKAGSNVGANGQKRSQGAEHARILKECVETLTATEHKWMIRILLRDLKIGMGERSVFQALHPDAVELFNTCSDILRVCWRLFDPNFRLPNEDNDVTPGSCFRPMLCQRNQRNLESIAKLMRKDRQPNADADAAAARSLIDPYFYTADQFMIEEKLDGERMQLHMIGDKFMYSSRKAISYTYLYGANKHSGSLTPFIYDLFRPEIEECILDGEMMVWDPALDKYVPFGTLKTFAQKTSFDADDCRPCLIVFDIVYLKANGHVQRLLTQPLFRRKKLLAEIFTPRKGVIEIAEVTKHSTAQDISNRLKYILETRGEGLCIKNPDSPYVLGGRLQSWVKVKPEYMDELGENVDAVVIGGYWGTGKRAGRMSSFMVGLRDETKPEVDGQSCFFSFAKVGTGFNFESYNRIHEKTDGKWIEYDKKKKQHGWFQTVTEYPDVLINPSDSFVVSIKAAEIVGGNEYGAGMTLRFPRATRVRDDLDCTSCMSFNDVQEFRNSGTKRAFGNDLSGKKKVKAPVQSKKARTMTARLDNVVPVADLFKGYVFYVHRGPTKVEIEKAVVSHGGRIIQAIPDPSELRIVIAEKYEGIKSKKGASNADILLPAWVEDSIKAQRLVTRVQRYYVHATPETEASEEFSAMEDEIEPSATADDSRADPKSESEAEDEDEDVKPVVELAPRFAYRSEDLDQDDQDEVAGSESNPEPETDSDSNDDVKMGAALENAGPLPTLANCKIDPEALTGAPPGMGAGTGEQHFEPDPAKAFQGYVAYFDTVENAAANDLPLSAVAVKTQERQSKLLREAADGFVKLGGVVTERLDEPSLTHIIVHGRERTRFAELMRRTCQPRNRRLVSHDWIVESIAGEDGALDVLDYAP